MDKPRWNDAGHDHHEVVRLHISQLALYLEFVIREHGT
jgi:hypothetical protein